MSKKSSHLLSQIQAIPPNMPFVQLSYELLNSPAWRAMSIPCRKLIEFLLLENMAHKGTENGFLYATYDQLAAFGIARQGINSAIQEAENLGFLEVNRRGRQGRNKNYLNHFRLTFLPYSFYTESGLKQYGEPSNEWRRISEDDILQMKGKQARRVNITNHISDAKK